LEGIVDALRGAHCAVVPDGIVIEMHPSPIPAQVQAGGGMVGQIESNKAIQIMRDTEDLTAEAVADGLFRVDRQIEFDYVERFDSADELIKQILSWDGYYPQLELRRRIRNSSAPYDVRLRVTATLLRPVLQRNE